MLKRYWKTLDSSETMIVGQFECPISFRAACKTQVAVVYAEGVGKFQPGLLQPWGCGGFKTRGETLKEFAKRPLANAFSVRVRY
jgi:hypothetical protein